MRSIIREALAYLLFAAAMLLFAALVLIWWAPRADATRPLPGQGWQRVDLCANVRGVQTVLDITTGHRYRVVASTPRGNVCRPIVRGRR